MLWLKLQVSCFQEVNFLTPRSGMARGFDNGFGQSELERKINVFRWVQLSNFLI